MAQDAIGLMLARLQSLSQSLLSLLRSMLTRKILW